MDDAGIAKFIQRWGKSEGAERANYQLFLTELCDAIGVDRPNPTVSEKDANAYVFEKDVVFDEFMRQQSCTGRRDAQHAADRSLSPRGVSAKHGVEKRDGKDLLWNRRERLAQSARRERPAAALVS